METKRLSYAQNEIMNLEQYYENTSINNIAGIIYIPDTYTYKEINEALNVLVKKNESYRLNIKKIGNKYSQIVSDYKSVNYEYIDFYNKKQMYKDWIKDQANSNIFALDKELYTFKILTLPSGYKGIFLKQHHLISDGWSMTLVIDFLKNELINHGNSEVSQSYIKTIDNEIIYENSKKLIKDEYFWNEKIEKLNNNGMFSESGIKAESKRASFNLDEKQSYKIGSFCSENKVSISNLFSAAVLLIKKSITNSNINSIGTMVHNRNTKEEKITTGLFSRVLPLIVEISDDLTVQEFLKLIKKDSFSLLKHRKYPFYKITEKVQSTKGLLDIIVSFQNTQYDSEFLNCGFSDEWIEKDTNDAPLSISISNRIGDGSLTIDFDYQVEKLNSTKIEILHKRIINVIKQILDNVYKKMEILSYIVKKKKNLY